MIDLTLGLPSPLPDAWRITGSVVATRSSSCSSYSVISETRFTCPLKMVSSKSNAAVASGSMKLRTSTWCCSKSQSWSLAGYFKRLIYLSFEGIRSSFSSNLLMSLLNWVRWMWTVPRYLLALTIVSAMVQLVQSIQSIWMQSLAHYYSVWRTNVSARIVFPLLAVWFVQVHVNAFRTINSYQWLHGLICTFTVNLTNWASQQSNGSKNWIQ